MTTRNVSLAFGIFALASTNWSGIAFTVPMFQEQISMQRTAPSKTDGVEIELPDFDELFGRIQQVSPLANLAIKGGGTGEGGGFQKVEETSPLNQKWKVIENKKRRTVHRIDKIDDFQGLGCPIVRFRASMKGPCNGEKFAEFIMNLDERSKWDPQIENVDEIYPIYDYEAANLAMGVGKYGDCSRLGIGYCQTKPNPVVDGREQLILCGIQDFDDGSTLIWGTELEDWHNHLLPEGRRYTRAKSHLFSTCIIPTGPETFDVEYILQLEVGGNLPTFLTTPILVQTVKGMFNHGVKVFQDDEIMAPYLKKQHASRDITQSLLMTP
mmetsp:Transcript_2642/g.3729  ORF Transcript_2642/g.3729 Transcript_2642/m.3729 type:complete len:325 (-) Transcript_2642:488-1462(-)